MQPFTDPAMVAGYAEATPLKVPGYADLHRMAMLLLAERAPKHADILVLGAGGGLELKAFAEAQPSWRFVGVDPSAEMLEQAIRILGPIQTRVRLQQGFIEDAPSGPFDGATCLLTLHFLTTKQRLRVLREIRRRLKPRAAVVVAHHSFPAGGDARLWLSRSIAFADRSSNDPARATASASAMAAHLPFLAADAEEALLQEAGFSDVALFYAGFSFRGWVAAA